MVCCRVGMGRSVSVVIAYLCCVEGLSYPDAVRLVLTRRPGGMPLPHLEEIIDDLPSPSERTRFLDRLEVGVPAIRSPTFHIRLPPSLVLRSQLHII